MLYPSNTESQVVRYAKADDHLTFHKRLAFYGGLPVGWHYGEGRAATPEAQRVALLTAISAQAQGFTVDVFPDLDGGVLVSIYGRGVTAEVNVLDTGTIRPYFVFEDRDEDEEGPQFNDPQSAIRYIERWNPELLSSAWYRLSTMSPKKGPSKTSYLSTAGTEVVYRYLTENVESENQMGYVAT